MSMAEIQREIQGLADDELKKLTACLFAERRKRAGVDLDKIVNRADREGRWVDWDDAKDEILNESDPA